jgi:hypothetical protein
MNKMKLPSREEITSKIIKELEEESLILMSADKALTNFIYLDEKLKLSEDEAKAIKGIVNRRLAQIQTHLRTLKNN